MRKLLFLATLLAAACSARADEAAADARSETPHHGATGECECLFNGALLEIRQTLDTARALLRACCPVETQGCSKCDAASNETEGIYVLRGEVDVTEPLSPEKVVLEQWPTNRIPVGAIRKLEDLTDRKPRQKIYPGEPVLEGKLFAKGESHPNHHPFHTVIHTAAECACKCATECNTKCSSQCHCEAQCANQCKSQCATACKTACGTDCTSACKHACKDDCAAHGSTACKEHCNAHRAHCSAACKTACDPSCDTACHTACDGHCAHCSTACKTTCDAWNTKSHTACHDHCHHACHSECGCESACGSQPGPGRVVLLRFEAPWCGPCQAMARQVFEHPKFKQALGQHCAVIRINIDDKPELAKKFGIHALPTCVIVSPDGKVIEKVIGLHGGEALLARLRTAAAAHAGCPVGGCPCAAPDAACCPHHGTAYVTTDNTQHNDAPASGDVRELATFLGREFPNASLQVYKLSKGVVVSGTVDDPRHVPQIVEIAQDYFPKVINRLAVGRVRQAQNCPACQCGSSCQCAPGKSCNPECSCGGPRVGSRCMVTAGSANYHGVLRRIDPTWVVIQSESDEGVVHWIPSRGVQCISVPSEPAPGATNQVHHEPKSDPFSPGIPPGFRVCSVDVANPEACRNLRAGDRIDLQIESNADHPSLAIRHACVFAVSSRIGTGEAAPAVQLSLLLTPQQCQRLQSVSTPPFCCRVVSVSLDGPAHVGSHQRKPRSGLIWSFDETGDLLVDHKWTCPAGHEGCVACPPQTTASEDVHLAPPSLETPPAQYLEERWATIPPPNPVYVPHRPRPQTNHEQPTGSETLPSPYFATDDVQHFLVAPKTEPEAAPAQPPRPRHARGHHHSHGHRRQAAQQLDELRQFLVRAQLTETDADEETKVISRPRLMTIAGQPACVEIDDQFKLEMTITPSRRYDDLLEVTVVDGSDETLRSVASIRSGDSLKLQWSGPPHAQRWLECTVVEVQKEPTRHVEYLPEPPSLDPIPPQPLPAPQKSQPHHVQVYAVADLVANGPEGKPDFAPLLEQIKSQVAPGSWSDDGGQGLIHPFGPNRSIVVRQTPEVHAHLGKYLDQQREKNFSRTVRFETIVPGVRRPAPEPEPKLEALPAPPTAPLPIDPPPKRPAPPAPPELLPPR